MIPSPPWSRSNRRIGQGFQMSKIRKQMNAAAIQGMVLGTRMQVAHIPINSSQTACFGSGLTVVDILPVAQIPSTNPVPMSMNNPGESPVMGANQYIAKATKLPAVAGATGNKPEPKPAPITQAKRAAGASMKRLIILVKEIYFS